MKRLFALASVAIFLAGGAYADSTLTNSGANPSVDGTIGASEYQYSSALPPGITLHATLGSDNRLYLAVEAPTSGWVAIGVGGLVMNGSRLFLAAIQDGKPAFIEKTGIGHFYTDAKQLVVEKWSVATKGNDTVLELSIPASAAISKGQIKAICAYSNSPSFTRKHAAHASLTLTVK